jgi:Zn-dependent protease with chaperone function
VEITEHDQPNFFAFLRQLCRDTGAPMPRRVFLVMEVNAAVTYNHSPFALLLPTSKNLLVGLGLVNRLNVAEFKAVLAHEFGHFGQSSMKLGAYVYQANQIIADMVYGRDFFDDLLDRMRAADGRLDLFVKVFTGIIWGLRKALEGLFHAINFANSSLSRQMEFNADLVAVRVAGSDAIVHALARLDFANETLDQALQDLTAAADQSFTPATCSSTRPGRPTT